MNERVRIYELARKMNLENQDVITALRELGYDIKSHSSTIDSHAVGLLIQHIGKKNKALEAAKAPKAPKVATKAAAPPPPPPTPAVKPRVLARYRPAPPTAEPTGEAQPAAAPTVEPQAKTPPVAPVGQQAVQAPPPAPVAPAEVEAPPAPSRAVQEQRAALEEIARASAISSANRKKPVEAPPEKQPEAERKEKPEDKDVYQLPEFNAAPPVDESSETTQEDLDGGHGHAVRGALSNQVKPMSPSVPIRIAAPSFRATPPRPPKTHRAPSERHGQKTKEEKVSRPAATVVEVPKIIALTTALTVQELAEKMATSETEIIKRLFIKGHMRTVNQLVELELARDLAIEMGYELASQEDIAIEKAIAEEEEAKASRVELTEEDIASQVTRPPVVTIMGHVDHGKTSLLDAIRQTKFLLTDAEHGGITQHIGAYHVEVPAEDGSLRQIVFLDTPGHEAFTAMRARGAKATDIAILVVAADDGVMPQTIEAIDHCKAAGVPIIVAVNKIDKSDADPDQVLNQLMNHSIVPDRFGGDTVTVNVSAKKRVGLDELLEMILLVSDIADLKANPEKPAVGTIIEAELSRGRGAVATALVQNGTLREGDFLVAGSTHGRVRALLDDRGERVKAAGPSMPVAVLGLTEVPAAGDKFEVVPDAQAAKALAEQRKLADIDRNRHRVTLESFHELMEHGEVKELNIIIKADVQGTAEAIAEQVSKLSTKEVQVRVLRIASGDISENDVNLAASSAAIIMGFNVQPDANARSASEAAGVDIRTYNIIYQIVDDLNLAVQGLLQPIRTEVEVGQAEVRQLFKVGKNLQIAGCMVINGKIPRGGQVRIEREGAVIYEGKIDTLKRFKDDVREVAQGFECGMSFDKFNDLKEGDIVRAFQIQETKRELTR
jgi:translation initiation factor IF-2